MKFDKDGKLIIPERKVLINTGLAELIKRAKSYNNEDHKKALEELKEFHERFPITSISELTLERYCFGFDNSFCWWVDKGTREIAHMFQEGLNRNWGIWFQKEERQYYSKEGSHKNKIDEETAKRKLIDIKKAIISIINSAKNNDFDSIEEERELWHQAKAKIVYLYFPEKTLPILSKDHLKALCEDLGLTYYKEDNHLESSNRLLNALKKIEPFNNWHTLKIAEFIYKNYKELFNR